MMLTDFRIYRLTSHHLRKSVNLHQEAYLTQPTFSDTGGSFFPKAMTHLLVGMYIQEVALCALFFLARNANGKVSAIPQGVLMIILIVSTVSDMVDRPWYELILFR
jgi:hypothetical protein